jgi:hypothetical protein
MKQGYSCSHLSVCLSVLEKINSPNSKVEYNGNNSSDLLQILNLSLGDQTKMKFGLKYEMKMTSDGPLMEDDLKILKVEYQSNQNKFWLEI